MLAYLASFGYTHQENEPSLQTAITGICDDKKQATWVTVLLIVQLKSYLQAKWILRFYCQEKNYLYFSISITDQAKRVKKNCLKYERECMYHQV